MFESRLSKIGQGPKSTHWHEVTNDQDQDEVLVRNTYVNGLLQKTEKSYLSESTNLSKPFSSGSKKIQWADNNNMHRKDLLCSTNFSKELIYQKDIKPILTHKKLKPTKSCLKQRSSSYEIKKSSSQLLGKISESIVLGTNQNHSGLSNSNSSSNKNITNNNFSNLGNIKTKESVIGGENLGNLSNNSSNKLAPTINYPVKTSDGLLKNYTPLGNSYQSKTNMITSSELNKDIVTNNYFNNKNNFDSSIKKDNVGISFNNLAKDTNNSNLNQRLNNQNTGTSTRTNNFEKNSNGPSVRSYSVGGDPNNRSSSNIGNNVGGLNNNPTNLKGETKIIIASEVNNIANNYFHNIYIQSPEDLEKLRNYNSQNFGDNPLDINKNERTSIQTKKENMGSFVNNDSTISGMNNKYHDINSNLTSSINIGKNSLSGINSLNNTYSNKDIQNIKDSNLNAQNTGKLIKSNENQRQLNNNYLIGSNNNIIE